MTGRVVGDMDRWPVRKGGVTGKVGYFGNTRRNEDGSDKKHYGVDWLSPVGAPAYAAHDGRIQRAGEQSGGKGYGQRIYLISEANKVLTIYAHLSAQFVMLNDIVRPGDCIGLVGRSGNVGDRVPTHLHHEVRLAGEGKDCAVDPEWWYYEETA
jgi:murein DD-endopeptidase MepM/ murein hydrolase activator NlpD